LEDAGVDIDGQIEELIWSAVQAKRDTALD
jgi:hypothetical protein